MVIALFGFSTENTWEPEENLDCQDLITAFHDHLKAKKDEKKRKSTTSDEGSSKKKKRVAEVYIY